MPATEERALAIPGTLVKTEQAWLDPIERTRARVIQEVLRVFRSVGLRLDYPTSVQYAVQGPTTITWHPAALPLPPPS